MTQPPTDSEEAPFEPPEAPPEPAPAPPQDRRPARPPAWPYFLTPIAVLLGAAAIVITLVLLDDDPQPEPIGPALESLSRSVESLSEAAESLSESAAQPPAAREPAEPAAAPRAPTTLREAVTSYAVALNLDVARFDECLSASATYEAVAEQAQRAIDLGLNGTPSFFVNNKFISGAQPTEIFTEVIAAELNGSPTSIDEYSEAVQVLAQRDPPAFAIVADRPDISGAPIEGSPDAPVVIIEYSDFQCPFCQRWFFNSLPDIRELVGENVALAFVHFPLTQLHPNAATVHVAAQCAGEQDKFWEMHDLLFQQQNQWATLPNVN